MEESPEGTWCGEGWKGKDERLESCKNADVCGSGPAGGLTRELDLSLFSADRWLYPFPLGAGEQVLRTAPAVWHLLPVVEWGPLMLKCAGVFGTVV